MVLRDWAIALQVPLFVAVVAPTLVGAAAAIAEGHALHPLLLALALAALVLIQGATNLQKAYFEARDLPRRPDGPAVASYFAFDVGVLGRLPGSPRTHYRLSLALLALAALLGLVLDAAVGGPGHVILLLGLAGVALAFTYSGPPLKMSYRGLGEVNTFLAFGPLAVVGVHYTQAGVLSPLPLLASLPLGGLTAALSLIRSFPTEAEDRLKGKGDPVVRLGPRRARGLLAGLLAATFALALLLPAFGLLPPGVLLLLLLVPLGAVAIAGTAGCPSGALRAVKAAVLLDLLGGLLLALGLLLPRRFP